MDLGFALPPSDFFADWLEEDAREMKHDVQPLCYLSRQGRKTRRIKHQLQNYIFVVPAGHSFTAHQFKSMLLEFLHLDHEFQLFEANHNKFIRTLETQMPTEYACAVLEEGRMIRLGETNILCYPTDEYAEGHFGGDLSYDIDDEVADLYLEVRIHALPLHLRTTRAVERILLRYCVVQSVDEDCLDSKKLEYVSCACRAQRGITFPKFIIIKVASRFSYETGLISTIVQKHIQTYCVAIVVKLHGHPHPAPSYQLQANSFYFSRAAHGGRVGCCFLRDVDVSTARFIELQQSVLLRPRQLGLEITPEQISACLQEVAPCLAGQLAVQSIGV